MNLNFMEEQVPFNSISTIELNKGGLVPETNLREVPDQNAFYTSVNKELIRFIRVSGKMRISDRVEFENFVTACFVLSSGRLLVVTDKSVIFYTDRLKHIKTIKCKEINEGLDEIRQSKKVEGTDSNDFIMLASIDR